MISHRFVVPRYSFFTSNHSLPKSAFCRPAHFHTWPGRAGAGNNPQLVTAPVGREGVPAHVEGAGVPAVLVLCLATTFCALAAHSVRAQLPGLSGLSGGEPAAHQPHELLAVWPRCTRFACKARVDMSHAAQCVTAERAVSACTTCFYTRPVKRSAGLISRESACNPTPTGALSASKRRSGHCPAVQ